MCSSGARQFSDLDLFSGKEPFRDVILILLIILAGLMVTFVIIHLCVGIKGFCENKRMPRNEFARDRTNAFVIHPR